MSLYDQYRIDFRGDEGPKVRFFGASVRLLHRVFNGTRAGARRHTFLRYTILVLDLNGWRECRYRGSGP